jgi:sodium/hydrogen exchanger 8
MLVGALLYAGSQNGIFFWPDSEGLTFAECLTFGSLISATDPVSTLAIFQDLGVNRNLYYTVLGESIFNDAVGLVLFRTFGKFVGCDFTAAAMFGALGEFIAIFLGSTAIGIFFGFLTAFIFKHINLREDDASPFNLIELSVVLW